MTELHSHYLRAGHIILVSDPLITIPPNAEDRVVHTSRPAIVVSADVRNEDPSWPFVLVVPTTTNSAYRSEICVPLFKAKDKVTKDCIARVPLLQPLYKEQLNETNAQIGGKVGDEALAAIMAAVVDYLAFDSVEPTQEEVVLTPTLSAEITPLKFARRP